VSLPLIEVRSVSKKFCRSLKRSLWYGLRDLGGEVFGRSGDRSTLRRDEFWAVRNASFELYPGETLGLIGPNGAGKTTLLRLLHGLITPDEGSVTVRGRMQALIALGAGFSPILTGRENIYVNASILGITGKEVARRFDEIVDFAGIPDFIDSPVQTYSSGMTVRLGFAVAAHLEPDILLVDEVLAVGDEGFQVKCLNKIGELKASGTAIVLVSHNMHIVSTYCDRVLVKNALAHELFTDVGVGVQTYKRLVHPSIEGGIEKHCSAAAGIEFVRVDIPRTELAAGSSFHLRLHYRATTACDDIEIDITLRVAGEAGWHFQATNRTFDQRVDLPAGEGWLDITVHDLRAVHADGRWGVTIWRRGRSEVLFWWRIPVRFTTALRSSGTNLYRTTFGTHLSPPEEVRKPGPPVGRSGVHEAPRKGASADGE
jgi:lipopolysaccharide transport system ATP-binding protein